MNPSPPSLPSNRLLLSPLSLKHILKYSENGISISFTWLISFLSLPTLGMISFPRCCWYDRINRPIRFFVPLREHLKTLYSVKPFQQTQATLEQLPADRWHDPVLLWKGFTSWIWGHPCLHINSSIFKRWCAYARLVYLLCSLSLSVTF